MKRLLLILLVLICSSIAFAAIDETKTDVYFANGVWTEKKDAKRYAEFFLQPAIIDFYGIETYRKTIGKVTIAYNETESYSLVPTVSVGMHMRLNR